MHKMKSNFRGLVQLLAKNLYSDTNVFVRELIQNAHDSIRLVQVNEPNFTGRIDITTHTADRTITFADDGLGMDEHDLHEFLSTIGRSGTGTRTAELANQNISAQTIGQFGIGLLSAFVVAERIDVFTRKRGDASGWHWLNHGSEDYEVMPTMEAPDRGTEVVVHLREEHGTYLEEKEIEKAIRAYADFIPIPIHLNGRGPVNCMNAPWHVEHVAESEAHRTALQEFVLNRSPDRPLLIIPVNLQRPRAKGVLYVSDQPVSAVNTSGVVDLYQSRMCIRVNDNEVLPEFAKFIRGVIDSPDLQPTASRDSVQRDRNYYDLRVVLGTLIVDALTRLATTDALYFQKLCTWHHAHFKGMAVHNDEFFKLIIGSLPFETNEGKLTLPEYLNRTNRPSEGRARIYYYSFDSESSQFSDLCHANQLIAINAGRQFDEPLLKKYAAHNAKVELKRLDADASDQIYTYLSDKEILGYQGLVSALETALHQAGLKRVKVFVRSFAPTELSGVLLKSELTETSDRLQVMLQHPFLIAGFEDIAAEMSQKLQQQSAQLFLNATNPLVAALRDCGRLGDSAWQDILLGLYYCALAHSRQRLRSSSIKEIHAYFQSRLNEEVNLRRALDDKLR